ncbi:hypothetical protein BFG52_07700 [Acinetobacter larvae]|uniref:Uncharacterized protein n=1 Tax=Acinetobacter larvae TaxID=1789224 RepID=A0A1B2LZB4_9GAMM|nr:hypothetical protein BFG52_07700 [Acinetobacter larvae]
MIGITKSGELIEISKDGPKGGTRLVGILICDPEELPQELIKVKVRYQSPDDQHNLACCQDILRIHPRQIQGVHGEAPSKPHKSYRWIGLSIHRFSEGFQIYVHTKPFRHLVQTLLKKLQS